MQFIVNLFSYSLWNVLLLAYDSAWLIAPFVLGFVAFKVWVYYVNTEYLRKIKWALLEVKIPKEIRRSPLAMELVLNSLHQTGGTATWYDRYVLGKLRAYFSLEIVSVGGQVHFLIRTPEAYRNAIESYIYAQYPETEIVEVPDYTKMVDYSEKDGRWSMFGTEFVLIKPDPYPIKTYLDYGADKIAKEEEKIDPITPTIELMGSMLKGEQLWLQILVRATHKSWKDLGKAEIEKLKAEKLVATKEGEAPKFNEMALTKGEKDAITAIERSIDKLGFDIGIRAIYIAEKEAFRGPNIPAMINILKQYNSNNLNGFRPNNVTAFNFPWQDFKGNRAHKLKVSLFNLYRSRGYFYPPKHRNPFVLSSEELATIYHFPGGVSGTPSFTRIESKKSEPPVNLPI